MHKHKSLLERLQQTLNPEPPVKVAEPVDPPLSEDFIIAFTKTGQCLDCTETEILELLNSFAQAE